MFSLCQCSFPLCSLPIVQRDAGQAKLPMGVSLSASVRPVIEGDETRIWTKWFLGDTLNHKHKMSVPVVPSTVKNLDRVAGTIFQSDLQLLRFLSVTLPLFSSSAESSRRRRKWIW